MASRGGQISEDGAEPDEALDCFDTRTEIECGTGRFAVYTAGFDGGMESSAILVLLHGAGCAACSWALCARALKNRYRIIAMDLRGHGATVCAEEDDDLSLPTLHADLLLVLQHVIPRDRDDAPPLVLVGHSMGAALAVHAAAQAQETVQGPLQGALQNVRAVVLVEASEGAAKEAFANTEAFLANRPTRFKDSMSAVEWALASGLLCNRESARVSIPPTLAPARHGEDDGFFLWRTAMDTTREHWAGWFEGMSRSFLALKGCGKLVIVAHTDSLDKDLMVGQMQGLFQVQVVPTHAALGTAVADPGRHAHFVHEDYPDFVANAIGCFLKRQNL